MVRVTMYGYGNAHEDRAQVEVPGSRFHVAKDGDGANVLYVYAAGGGEPVAAFNEWAYAEVIKDEVTFVRHEDGVLVPPAG